MEESKRKIKPRAEWTPEQKKAQNEYIYQKSTVIGCKADRATAEAFQAYAERVGKTKNALILDFVKSCINSAEQPEKKSLEE